MKPRAVFHKKQLAVSIHHCMLNAWAGHSDVNTTVAYPGFDQALI